MKIVTHRKGLKQIAVPSPTIPPATTTNAWILSESIIVDPAAHTKKNRTSLLQLLQDIPLQTIFLTHHHRDHIGAATFLRENLNIPIQCSATCARQLNFQPDIIAHDGEILRYDQEDWHILETPGHAQGHLCLHSPEHNDIIAGDMVAGEGTILLIPGDGDFGDYIEQLTRLRNLSPRCLYPAHGPVIINAIDYLQHYIDHRKMRLSQILSALDTIPHSPINIAKKIYTDLHPAFLPVAAKQVECHLLYLEKQKQAQSNENGWALSN